MIDVPRDDLVLMLESGFIYLAMGKFTEAKQVFEGVATLMPKSEVPIVGVANVLFAQKKFLPAIRTLKEAIDLNSESAFAHAHLGEAYLFYGKREEALKSLEQAMTLDAKGHAGGFAKALIDLMNQGYDPVKLKQEAGNQPTA